jgi:hypothetical protein
MMQPIETEKTFLNPTWLAGIEFKTHPLTIASVKLIKYIN